MVKYLRMSSKLILVALVVMLLVPQTAKANELGDLKKQVARQQKVLKQMQRKIGQLEAKQAAVSPSDKKQLEVMVDKILADRPQIQPGPTDLRAYWKEGLRFETQNKDFTFKFGGRLMYDFGWISEDDALKTDLGELQDGSETRRARLYMSGLIYDSVEFKVQFDFAGGDADLKDAYVGLIESPFGRIRAGHFKEPFGLEELTSSKYITFMERSTATEAFSPSRNAGLMFFDTMLGDRGTWAVGMFRETDDYGDGQDDGGYSVTGRVTALPVYENNGASLLHVGAAYSYRNTSRDSGIGADAERYRSRPENHMTQRFVDTGNFASGQSDLLGLEAAWVSGPLSVQSEYIYANADLSGNSSSGNFNGYYVQASYFLTGEHRKYKKSSGAFSRIKPKKNYGSNGGWGAWELAGRYSSLDLDDSTITGGKLDTITVGLNWYLNPNTRLMWNYVYADKDDVGQADMFLARLQVDF